MIYANTELFFSNTLDYGIKSWKSARTRTFNALNIGNTSELSREVQFRILTYIANSSSTKKKIAQELLSKFFVDFKEDKTINVITKIVEKYANKYNVDSFELQERYRIIKRDMLEKNIHPDFKLQVYKFGHTIKLTKIVLEIFKEEKIDIVGEFPKEKKKEIVIETPKKKTRKKKGEK